MLTSGGRFGLNPPFERRPIIYLNKDETIRTFFSRRPLVGTVVSPRSEAIPRLSPVQKEALDVIQSIAEEEALTVKLKEGHMLFWNNAVHLHSRKAFTDSLDNRRHLLRLWLRSEIRRAAVPQELRSMWDDAFVHNGRAQLWPLEPIVEQNYICNRQRPCGHA